MKNSFAALILAVTFASAHAQQIKTSARPARQLHFHRGATLLKIRGHLSGSQPRFYTLQTRAGQRLQIRVAPAAGRTLTLVPLLFVTPPRGHFDGEKTAIYTAKNSRAGTYQIEIAANLMASNARSGSFVLWVSAR